MKTRTRTLLASAAVALAAGCASKGAPGSGTTSTTGWMPAEVDSVDTRSGVVTLRVHDQADGEVANQLGRYIEVDASDLDDLTGLMFDDASILRMFSAGEIVNVRLERSGSLVRVIEIDEDSLR